MYAETLRIYIAIFTIRHRVRGFVSLGSYKLGSEDWVIVYSRIGAIDDKSWARSGSGSTSRPGAVRMDGNPLPWPGNEQP